jgi:hypothetical protein
VAYRSAMFAIVFFSSFLLLFATGRSVSLDALLGWEEARECVCLLFRNALGILVKYRGF